MKETNTREHPIKVGDVLVMEIDGLGHAGEGVGRVKGFAVFVADAIPGDEVLVRIDAIRKSYGRASVLEIRRPSLGRILPTCADSSNCGGCQLRHMEYRAQLVWKRQTVTDALTRIGKLDHPEVKPVIGMDLPDHYRNKVHYPVASVGDQVVLGFYRRNSHELVPIEECANAHPLCNRAIKVIGPLLSEYGLTPYNGSTNKGLMRHVICRVSIAREQLMVIFVTNGAHIPKVDELLTDMQGALPELVTVAQNVNRRRTSMVLGEETRIICGEPHLIEELNGLSFAISPNSFFQVNSQQAAVLSQLVVDYASTKVGTRALDCYSGTGSLALHLAREGAHVLGIEEVGDAVRDAKLNAALNGLEGTDFRVGRVEVLLPGILKEGRVDVAVVDPPRKGCEPEVLEALIAAGIPRLVYVSCNPSSLARDLAVLADGGYVLQEVQPVDMFPHTSHVETVVSMSRVEK